MVQPTTARSRLHGALICPYCRDAVFRRGTLVCARRGCGALYHRACWAECSTDYGGCAIYGCEGKKALEVSVTGFIFKLVRLAVAALVFPPRLVRAIRHEERHGRSLLARALHEARRFDPRRAKGGDAADVVVVYVLALPASLVGAANFALFAVYGSLWRVVRDSAPSYGLCGTASFVMALMIPFATLAAAFAPAILGFLLALVLNSVRLFARVLRAEIAALGRSDAAGDSILGRLHRGNEKA